MAKSQEFIPAAIAHRLFEGESPIRVYREYRGMTQDALAATAKISLPFLSQLENRARAPSIATARKLAKGLRVDVDDLI